MPYSFSAGPWTCGGFQAVVGRSSGASLVFCDDSRVSGRAAGRRTNIQYIHTWALSKAARPVAVPSCKGGVETSHAEALAVPRVEAGCESMSPCSLRSGLKRRPSAVTVLAIHTAQDLARRGTPHTRADAALRDSRSPDACRVVPKILPDTQTRPDQTTRDGMPCNADPSNSRLRLAAQQTGESRKHRKQKADLSWRLVLTGRLAALTAPQCLPNRRGTAFPLCCWRARLRTLWSVALQG